MSTNQTLNFSFEEAYARLEKILSELNSGEVALERSLALYEEADRLIGYCTGKLRAAEKKVQTLIKNREGDLVLDEGHQPQVEDFEPEEGKILHRQCEPSRDLHS